MRVSCCVLVAVSFLGEKSGADADLRGWAVQIKADRGEMKATDENIKKMQEESTKQSK